MLKVLSFGFDMFFSPFTMLLVKGLFETGLFRHLSNYVYWSRKVQKYISYKGHLFLKMFKLESKFRKLKKTTKIQQIFFVSEIITSDNIAINCLC